MWMFFASKWKYKNKEKGGKKKTYFKEKEEVGNVTSGCTGVSKTPAKKRNTHTNTDTLTPVILLKESQSPTSDF